VLGRTRIHTRARGSGAGSGAGSDLQKILALSPSLLIWPAQTTMTVATNGTGAAPTTGQSVGRILDLSGNGNNLIAGTWASPSDAARATLTAGNALNFDGSSDHYSLLNAISITTNMTVVRAFKRASAGISTVGLGISSADFPAEGRWGVGNFNVVALGATQTQSTATFTDTGSFVFTAQRTASVQSLRRNGAGVALASSTPPTVSGSFDSLGRLNALYNNGEISFLALFPTELTGADLALVEQIAAATNGATLG